MDTAAIPDTAAISLTLKISYDRIQLLVRGLAIK